MKQFIGKLLTLLEEGTDVFVAIVVSSTKGSPGTPGACLLLPRGQEPTGTIGGGIMEKRLLEFAENSFPALAFEPQLQELGHSASAKAASGLICGGKQTNLLFALSPKRDLAPIKAASEFLHANQPAIMAISAQGIRCQAVDTPQAAVSRFATTESSWTYHASLFEQRRALVCGAGHCGAALSAQMSRLGFHVTLFDQRADCDHGRFSADTTLFAEPPESALADFAYPNLTYAVIMTHSYPSDLAALKTLLPQNFKFIGLMGSPPKLEKIKQGLAKANISLEQIDQMKAPVGLPIGSDTPEEISISVAAQILLQESAI